jgi:hypothetical protein
MNKQKLYSTDDIILFAIREKHSFESHKSDIIYADHHKKTWLLINLEDIKKEYNDKTMTLSQLKNIINKQLKV